MGFNIDFEKMSLDACKQLLIESNLVPSRMLLKENIVTNFKFLERHNIHNVNELLLALKNQKSIDDLAERTGISVEYLTVLIREIKGYKRKPIKIREFPGLHVDTAEKLSKTGIENTIQLFNKVIASNDRELLSEHTGIDKAELLMATKLTDLSRIRWVNHTFAYVLYECGYDTAEKVASADPEEMCEIVKRLNEERKFFPAHVGLKDIKRCIEAAKMVPLDIKY